MPTLKRVGAIASVFTLATLLYPPLVGRYNCRAWAFLFSSSPAGRIDYGRLALEIVVGFFAALVLASLPVPTRWKLPRLRLPKKVRVAMLVFGGCLLCLLAAWFALRISKPIPSGELAKAYGEGRPYSGVFSGRLYNGSDSWTIRELTIRVTFKPNPPPPAPPGFQVIGDERDYRIRDLWIRPLEARDVAVDVLPPSGFEFDTWQIVSAKGFKNYW